MSETVTERQALERVEAAGLVIRRVRRGRGFSYLGPDGKRIDDVAVLARIRGLAIPPAYEEVRIAASASAHLQAIGRDAAGRLQYRYHPDWDLEREAHKAERLETLIEALPRIRAAVRRDIALATLRRRKAVACAVALIDATHIRVGCELYLQSSGARGAATLLKRQVKLNGRGLALNFRGKGGAQISCTVEDRALVRAIRRIATIRGSRLLQYVDETGAAHPVRAADVNAYLKRISGRDISAKDFRMLAASATAAEHLAQVEPAPSERSRRRQIAEVMKNVSADLANTPTVARKSYVHALVVQAFEDGVLPAILRRARSGRVRSRGENALARLLRATRTAPG